MAAKKRSLIGGVDTHRDTHRSAVIDSLHCLRRYIVRDVHTVLRADFAALAP
ncbi:hypothetical protein [Micromonospora noduli]|uniref:hypothetical protein n=1 Tax=Micromonospora noduli TaxID=709876 RepID=UPI001788C783|nr:hypothetical protein [Micromonospora noduli]